MRRREFLDNVSALAETYRRTIEAECLGFDLNAAATQLRRSKAFDPHTGFEFFVNTYFPHYIKHPSKSRLHHYLFDNLPQIVRKPKSQSLAIAAPRGEAKSTLVSQLFVLWCVITDQKKYAVIVMDSIDQAYPMLEAIKAELEFNPRLASDFKDATGAGKVWQAQTIVTSNSIKIQVAGSGKKLRGLKHGAHRPDLVILDDIENDEQVRNPDQRDKLNAWLSKTVMPLGAAGGKLDIIYIGTILHYDSVLARTLNNPLWQKARFKAMITMPINMALWDRWEELLRNEGENVALAYYSEHEIEMLEGSEVSWEARPVYDLMIIRARDGHHTFDSEYQNDPVSGDDAPFTNSIQYWTTLPQGLQYFGACDPSLGKNGASRDPSAILVGGFDPKEGKLYVTVAAIKKRLPDKIIEDIITEHKAAHCLVWSIETVQFQEFLKTELVKRSAKQGSPVPAVGVSPHTDKLLRIESLQPHMANGLILLHASQQTLISQLRHFPKADHDDGPDALHMLWALAVSRAHTGGFIEVRSDYKIDVDDDNYCLSRR